MSQAIEMIERKIGPISESYPLTRHVYIVRNVKDYYVALAKLAITNSGVTISDYDVVKLTNAVLWRLMWKLYEVYDYLIERIRNSELNEKEQVIATAESMIESIINSVTRKTK